MKIFLRGWCQLITVVLVDDYKIIRVAIKSLLARATEINVVGEAANGTEALRLVRTIKPNVVLMDIQMPGIDGLEATWRITRYCPQTKVIVISIFDQGYYPVRLLATGAMGYLSKECAPQEIIKAVRTVAAGRRYISPSIANYLALQQIGQSSTRVFDILSLRELQISLMVMRGKKTKEIADLFCISEKTVKANRYSSFKKLNVHNDVQLVLLAQKVGLLAYI
jgi:two-component system invasion response regulator UvrY